MKNFWQKNEVQSSQTAHSKLNHHYTLYMNNLTKKHIFALQRYDFLDK